MNAVGELVELPSGNTATLRRPVDLAVIAESRAASSASLLEALDAFFRLPANVDLEAAGWMLSVAAAFVDPPATTRAVHAPSEINVYEDLSSADIEFVRSWLLEAETGAVEERLARGGVA
jgi:hypothetical protein